MLSEADTTKTHAGPEVELQTFLTSTRQKDQLTGSRSDKLHMVQTGCECDKRERGQYLSLFCGKNITYP